MNFFKYNEIENTYRTDFIEKIKNLELDPNTQFACFTKIDGSNVSIILDEENKLTIAGRNQIVPDNDKYMNVHYVVEKMNLKNKFETIKKLVAKKYGFKNDKFQLQIYGELCGGFYRHKEVEPIKGAVKIQGRVSYNPDNVWIPFDGFAFLDERQYYFDVDTLASFCKEADLPCQIERFRGTLEECLNFDNVFIDDTGNKLFGLPLIEDNISEGVVIKPIIPIWFKNGERVILKNKTEKFKEKKKKEKKEHAEPIPLKDIEIQVLNILDEYNTESRLLSVISKEVIVNDKLFGKILGLFILDCINDAIKDHPEIEKYLKEKDKEIFDAKRVRRLFQDKVVPELREQFIAYLTSIV
jgi:Rnl2 family RNA ligase